MIAGIGTDIVLVSRIQMSLNRFGNKFAARILTEPELKEFQRSRSQAHFLAKRFAAKEAVAKALGTGMRRGVSFATIGVTHDSAGRPGVVVLNAAAELAGSLGIVRWHLSLSDEQDHALAFVVAES